MKNAYSTTIRPAVPANRDWGIVDAVSPRMTAITGSPRSRYESFRSSVHGIDFAPPAPSESRRGDVFSAP